MHESVRANRAGASCLLERGLLDSASSARYGRPLAASRDALRRAPHRTIHRRRRAADAIEQIDDPGALPAIPAGVIRERIAFTLLRLRRRRVVRLVLEHQRVARADA